MTPKTALYLSGGGARGAYQAGALKAISEIIQTKALPFSMISGVSVGCINAAILAQHADDFSTGVDRLVDLWTNIHCENVFNTSNYELGKSVFRNLSHFVVKQNGSGFLLDTSPLSDFICANIDFNKIYDNIAENRLETMEVITNCYESQQTISFYMHNKPQFEDWIYPRHTSKRTIINKDHIIASAALPLFFPTIKIEGRHYGDGSIGLISPLRGALRFNVQKIMTIGTRQLPTATPPEKMGHDDVGFAQVLGNMLNGLFLDNLDRDIETVNRMNEIAKLLSIWKKHRSPWRPVETIYLRPGTSMALMAQDHYQSMPKLLRVLLNFLGAKSHSGDLLSFLLFEKEFTTQLIETGYKDTMANGKAVTEFFN